MEQEWSVPVEFEGAACGRVAIRREGLYLYLVCDCEPVSREILRAYLVAGGGRLCLGVLEPEGGRLRLYRRFPASHFPPPPYGTVTLAGREDVWEPWSGTILDCEIRDALSRIEEGRCVVAIPFSEPFSHPALLRLGALRRIGERDYLAVPACIPDEMGL